jgi:hypothetical protein
MRDACGTLVLHSNQTQTFAIDFRAESGSSPQEDALVALAGRHVKWTSLAVQQQLSKPKAMLTT